MDRLNGVSLPGRQWELELEGLHCAHCAARIEAEVNRLAGVEAATLNFLTKTLAVQLPVLVPSGLFEEICAVIRRIEPQVAIREIGSNPADEASERTGEQDESAAHRRTITRLAGGAVLLASALLLPAGSVWRLPCYLAAYLLAGGEVLQRAIMNVVRGQVFDENFLMAIASAGAFAIGEFAEGVAVMLFYQVGESLQDLAVERSRRSVRALLDIRPTTANLIAGADLRVVRPETVPVGAEIIIKPGERIPLDGEVLEGTSDVDTAALTGEAIPRAAGPGDTVLSGCINGPGRLRVRVTKPYHESTVARILDLVQNAASRKAPTENFITRFARYYTPAVVLTALGIAVVPPLFVPGAVFADWGYRALIFLVVSCPCALVVSIPLGFFGGIGAASRQGILIKGSNYLEALNAVDTVVFDKTGTLTEGVFRVQEVVPQEDLSADAVLAAAALAESYSNHPIARSILAAYGQTPDHSRVEEYAELPGLGVRLMAEGREIRVGNRELLAQAGIDVVTPDTAGTVVQVAVGGRYAGYIRIADTLRPEAAGTIAALRRLGVRQTVLLTGDSQAAGRQVADALGLDAVYAGLLPEGKVAALERLAAAQQPGRKTVFVGDGINDAPVLARADIGVAMGALGSAAAIEAADVVLMTDALGKLPDAIRIARRTRMIVWQNIVLALGVKGLVLLLGAGGLATMWEAVFADVGVALLAVLNAMRVMPAKRG